MVDVKHQTLYVVSTDWALPTHTIRKYFVCACDLDPISRSRQPQPCNNSSLKFTWTGSFALISNTVSSRSVINYDYNLCWVQRIHPPWGGGGGLKKQGNMSFIHKINIKIWWFVWFFFLPSILLACVWLLCVCVWFAIHAVFFLLFLRFLHVFWTWL